MSQKNKRISGALMEVDREIGEHVKRVRVDNKLSQEKAATLIGVHQTAWCRIEKGLQRMSFAQAALFCSKLQIDIYQIRPEQTV